MNHTFPQQHLVTRIILISTILNINPFCVTSNMVPNPKWKIISEHILYSSTLALITMVYLVLCSSIALFTSSKSAPTTSSLNWSQSSRLAVTTLSQCFVSTSVLFIIKATVWVFKTDRSAMFGALHVSDYRSFWNTERWNLQINSLASNNCFSHRNVFQNGVNALSKIAFKNPGFFFKKLKILCSSYRTFFSNFRSMWYKYP